MNTSPAKSPWIVDVDEASFQQQAVERSRERLVVIDFWAPWCGPCRTLGPMLEKLAVDFAGKFLLVKADTEKVPNVAAGFGVQSIPAVFAVRDGQILDFFVGVKPEGQLRGWIERLLPSPAEELVAVARQLADTDPAGAEAKFLEAAKLDANLAAAQIGLAELHLKQGKVDAARAILEILEQRGFLEPEAERLKAEIHLSAAVGDRADLGALRAAVADNPQDPAARLALSAALAAERQFDESLELALGVVQTHQKPVADDARKLMIDVFRLLPDDDPRVTDFRRRLSTALY